MSWTDVFPVLTDDMVKAYQRGVTKAQKAQYEDWFGVDRIINPQRTKHTVCFSLFWKNIHSEDPELPTPTRDLLKNARARGILKRFEPWKVYIQPLLDGAKMIRKARKDTSFRIYLAADMAFLANDFVRLGCEIRLMKSSSLRHNPGAMWRYLALDERETLVTFSDSDRAPEILADLDRTDTMARSGLGVWRLPWFRDQPIWGKDEDDQAVAYRPILGCQFGSATPLPARMLMEAVHWNTTHGHISTLCHPPGCGPQRVYGTVWPDYGYDEWLLQTAIYPRIARGGVLTFLPASARSPLLPLDIEYVSWANPKSEIVYFGSAGGCCGPAKDSGIAKGHDTPIPLSKFPQLLTGNLTGRHELPLHAKRADAKNLNINGQVTGWLNPSTAKCFGKEFMAYRTECEPRGQWSRISLCELDAAGVVVPGSNRLLHLPTPYGEWGAEDPKLLAWQGRLLLIYDDGWRAHLAELNEAGEALWSRELPVIAGSRKYADPLKRTAKQVSEMDDRCREKNWTLFAKGDELFLNYLVHPHVVYPMQGDKFQFGKPWVTEWQLPLGLEKLLGYSTPVLHDGCFWQAVHSVRQVGNEHKHEMRLLGFSAKAPFAVKWITSRPLLVGQKGGDALYPPFSDHQVVFCSSLQREQTGWRVRFAQNDRRLRSGLIEDRIVTQSLMKVKAGKG